MAALLWAGMCHLTDSLLSLGVNLVSDLREDKKISKRAGHQNESERCLTRPQYCPQLPRLAHLPPLGVKAFHHQQHAQRCNHEMWTKEVE